MGQELNCTATWSGQSSAGKALLEGDHLLFRGTFRVKAMFKDVTSIDAADGTLKLTMPEGALLINLGAYAGKWREKILHPPSRLGKLGVKPGTAVQLIGAFHPDFVAEVTAVGVGKQPFDFVFLAVEDRAALAGIVKAIPSLQPAGGIWVVYPKGVKTITEMHVIDAGRSAGLKDVKVASFSPTHTALKFVIPKDQRK